MQVGGKRVQPRPLGRRRPGDEIGPGGLDKTKSLIGDKAAQEDVRRADRRVDGIVVDERVSKRFVHTDPAVVVVVGPGDGLSETRTTTEGGKEVAGEIAVIGFVDLRRAAGGGPGGNRGEEAAQIAVGERRVRIAVLKQEIAERAGKAFDHDQRDRSRLRQGLDLAR